MTGRRTSCLGVATPYLADRRAVQFDLTGTGRSLASFQASRWNGFAAWLRPSSQAIRIVWPAPSDRPGRQGQTRPAPDERHPLRSQPGVDHEVYARDLTTIATATSNFPRIDEELR